MPEEKNRFIQVTNQSKAKRAALNKSSADRASAAAKEKASQLAARSPLVDFREDREDLHAPTDDAATDEIDG